MSSDYSITDVTSMKEILEMAVHRAEACFAFYKTAAERAPIKKTKLMLLQIAQNEKNHKMQLQSALDDLKAQMEIDKAVAPF